MASDFSGEWLSVYTYHDGAQSSKHIVTFQGDTELAGRSQPQSDGSELLLRLAYDPALNILTGTWHETTSPAGAYQGRVFHGALQLILNQSRDTAEGKWVGFNSGLTQVNTGAWRLEKQHGEDV